MIIQWKWQIDSRDLLVRVPEEWWTEVCNIVTGGSDQNYPKEKEKQEGKVVAWGGFTNSWGKKRSKKQREKGKDIVNWTQNSRE